MAEVENREQRKKKKIKRVDCRYKSYWVNKHSIRRQNLLVENKNVVVLSVLLKAVNALPERITNESMAALQCLL